MGLLVFLIMMIKYKIPSEASETETQKEELCLVMLLSLIWPSNTVWDPDEIISQHLFSVCTSDKFSLMKNVSLATSLHNN